jgi:hypothetical protein
MVLADGFWEIKNLNDVIAIVGLVLTLLSIWLAVYFARRDLQRTIEQARLDAKMALERFALSLLQRELGELSRHLREARDAIKRKEWPRAGMRLDEAEVHTTAALEDPRLSDTESELLRRVADDLTILRKAVAKLESVTGDKTLPQAKVDNLDQMIRSATLLDSRLRRRVLEATDVRKSDRTPPPPPPSDEGGKSDLGVPGG